MLQIYARNTFTRHIRRVWPWQVAIILAGTFAMAAALAVVASGLFLILLPMILVGVVAYRFLGLRRAGFPRPESDIIEGEYLVVSEVPADVKISPLNEAPRGLVTA